MALQTTVNKQLAKGMEGEFYDNSPRRVRTYRLVGTDEVVKAKATLTTTGNFSANDTVTVGVQTYTFKAEPSSAYEVLLGASAAASLTNLEKAINGTGTAGTTYGTGTAANALCTAAATSTTLVVTAKNPGYEGNSIAVAETGSASSFSGETLSGGSAVVNAKIGLAYTSNGTEGEAIVGGSGVFLGIAVNPKEFAIYNNFAPSMVLPNGTAGQLCTFGHVFVRVTADISIGQAAYFNTTTGEIKGATAGTDLSGSGFTEIKNSRFVEEAVTAGKIAKLELGN
jgi:hypothetical protein